MNRDKQFSGNEKCLNQLYSTRCLEYRQCFGTLWVRTGFRKKVPSLQVFLVDLHAIKLKLRYGGLTTNATSKV